MSTQFTKDDQRGLMGTISVATVLLLFSLWYTIDMGKNLRPSFIEVEFGEFQTGRLSEFSEVQNEKVATRQNPSEIKTETPVEEVPEPEEKPQTPATENIKPVDLPDQVEDVIEETVKTPETDVIDPTKVAEQEPEEEIEIPPQAQQDETNTEGADQSGDPDGAKGALNSDQGIGTYDDKTSPYELKWEGDIERAPMSQPLPRNNTNSEAVITVKFQVQPDGRVGLIIPVLKMNPELEKEVMSTLRDWRFSRLPDSAPKQAQWGTITFRFVFD